MDSCMHAHRNKDKERKAKDVEDRRYLNLWEVKC
jgi:hypothetical protein